MKYILMVLSIAGELLEPVNGQEGAELKGLRLYGRTESHLPVAGLRSDPITVEFDIAAEKPPDLQLRFLHCDRSWRVTETSFVNDDFYNRTRTELPFVTAPLGVTGYSYHYSLRVPDDALLKEFRYSGNYLIEIWDGDREKLLASSRFFVADQVVRPGMKIANRQEPSEVSPYNQVHQIEVGFSIPPPDSGLQSYFTHDFKTVGIYKNRELYRPWFIDQDDQDPHTFVEGFGTQSLVFRIDNIPPGAEYRALTLENIDHYPQDRLLAPRGGADVSRFLGKADPDKNGSSSLVRGTRYAEYLNFEFELLWEDGSDPIYVVGDFNQWRPGLEPMRYENGRYRLKTSLRRGRYDYQYVVGNDWIILEGNDWRTINRYTAFIYYSDPRFGGFERIVGIVRGQSPGGTSVTAY